MPLYMSPQKFRTGGWGVDLSEIEDSELRAILHRSSAAVNTYCSAPTLPVEHDFRGGTVTDEKGSWSIGHYLTPGQRRYYPFHRPLRSVLAMRLHVTNTQYNQFNAGELFVAPDFIEVVSLAMTQVGIFGAGVLPNIGLEMPQLLLTYTYGRSLPVLYEELEITDGRTFRASNQWWDAAIEPVVYIDGDEATTGFTLDYDEGTVELDEVTAETRVHVDYTHRLPSAIAEATGVIAADRLGERSLTRKGLHGLVELAVGEVRVRRDFPRAGVKKTSGIPDYASSLLDPYKFLSIRGGSF